LLPHIQSIKESVGGVVVDPCYEKGVIANVYEEYGWTVIKSDKYMLTDAFKPTGGIIITHTPYNDKHLYSKKFIDLSLPFAVLFSYNLQCLNTLTLVVLNKLERNGVCVCVFVVHIERGISKIS